MQVKTKIVVLGGGYAGLMAATRLARQTNSKSVEISLVNSEKYFVERVRDHQVAANLPRERHLIRDILRPAGVEFIRAKVRHLNVENKSVTVERDAGIAEIEFDFLIYALGSSASRKLPAGAGANVFALDYDSAMEFSKQLPELAREKGKLLIVGSGHIGVELATEIAEAYPQIEVELVSRRGFAGNLSTKGAAHFRRAFERFGIKYRPHSEIVELVSRRAQTAAGEEIIFDACIWTGGFAISPIAKEAGLQVNSAGQILVDPYLCAVENPNIYAVGDAALPEDDPGAPVRMSLYAAVLMGAHVADVVAAKIKKRRPLPFGMIYMAIGISLGSKDGLVQYLTWSRDTGLEFIFTGRIALGVRESFVRLALALIRIQHWLPPVFFYWPGKYKMFLKALLSRRSLQARHVARAN